MAINDNNKHTGPQKSFEILKEDIANLAVLPNRPTNIVDLGSTTKKFKDGHFAGNLGVTGTLTAGTLAAAALTGDLVVTGTVESADATTPVLSTAAGKTNTGYLSLTGKTSGSFKILPADATAQIVTMAIAAQTSGASTLTIPDQAGVSSAFVFTTLAQTLTNKTLTAPVITGAASIAQGAIDGDWKVLAASATYDASASPIALTGFSWTVVAGATYIFDVDLDTTMTTSGGLDLAFALTTATLTSIRYSTYAATATDNGTAVSTTGTTTTSATDMFSSKTAAYTTVRVRGSFVVNAGGTFALTACQETSAAGGDATLVLIGSRARVTRVL